MALVTRKEDLPEGEFFTVLEFATQNAGTRSAETTTRVRTFADKAELEDWVLTYGKSRSYVVLASRQVTVTATVTIG